MVAAQKKIVALLVDVAYYAAADAVIVQAAPLDSAKRGAAHGNGISPTKTEKERGGTKKGGGATVKAEREVEERGAMGSGDMDESLSSSVGQSAPITTSRVGRLQKKVNLPKRWFSAFLSII